MNFCLVWGILLAAGEGSRSHADAGTPGAVAESELQNEEMAALLQMPAAAREAAEKHAHYHYVPFVPLKSNTKHPIGMYGITLDRLCRFARDMHLEANVRLIGDLPTIYNLTSHCDGLGHGDPFTLADLKYSDVTSRLPSPEERACWLKFGGGLLNHDLVKIWLNKLPLLCDLAMQHPDSVTSLTDANSNTMQMRWVTDTAWRELEPGKLGTRWYKPRPHKRFAWFGNRKCTGEVVTWAKYMAVRGRDCPRLLDLWKEELAIARDSRGDCPCFDEEWLLSNIYFKHPELFQLQGLPQR